MEKKEMNTDNCLPVSRKLFEHPLWKEERVYSRFEAWLDLVQSVKPEDTRQLAGNRLIEIESGRLAVSLRRLAGRWKWSKHKVDNFLDLLVSEGMIKKGTAKGTGQSLVIICDYESYSSITENEGQLKGQDGNASGTVRIQGNSGKEGTESRGNLPSENTVSPEAAKAEFERFRKLYPGTKMGPDTEFENFKKKNPDYPAVVFALYPALEALMEWRKRRKASGRFVPEMANLQTWINQKRWEVELENSEEQPLSRTMEEIQAENKQKILERLKNGNT